MSTIEEDFVFQTMLTCIGNKRKLVGEISRIVDELCIKMDKTKLNILDGFSGSTVVSRMLAKKSQMLYCNDMEYYAYVMAICFLCKPTVSQQEEIQKHINIMNDIALNGPYEIGFITRLYAPLNTQNIIEGERAFYTRENALIIDTLRSYIAKNVPKDIQAYCLAPLLTRASIHVNTAGVFKGFYKDGIIGKFGGKGQNALERIMKPINIDVPIWSECQYGSQCYNMDICELIDILPPTLDLIYLDPPYNQHPYGSNYFMLNLIAKNEEPQSISKISGIPTNWKRSDFNTHTSAVRSMKTLLEKCLQKASYVLLSYNNEGIICDEDWNNIFQHYTVDKKEIVYDTYKGSRNLKKRNNKVVEIMYLISK